MRPRPSPCGYLAAPPEPSLDRHYGLTHQTTRRLRNDGVIQGHIDAGITVRRSELYRGKVRAGPY